MKPTVAVDANPLTRTVFTGTEVYARELITRLPGVLPGVEWILYSSRPAPGGAPDLTVAPLARLWSQARLPIELRRRRPDLFFAPSHVVPFLAPGRALTTVHDLAYERFPTAYGRRQRAYLRLTTRWAVRRCEVLLTVSESTRRDLVSWYGADPARIRVVPPGLAPPGPAAPGPRLGELGIHGPFALHVGRVEPRKNQLAALAAVERVPGLTLVSAGPVVDEVIAARLRASGRAVVLGSVSDADRERLYADASALIFPSLYEGFGFPVLEAMARGLPVVTVPTSSLPELGGEAVLYADGPHDVEGLATALERVLGDRALRRRLVAAGRRRAGGYSWERTASGVGDVIRQLLD
jgi:glycosyltransferase involved in cell wall biosynthesis